MKLEPVSQGLQECVVSAQSVFHKQQRGYMRGQEGGGARRPGFDHDAGVRGEAVAKWSSGVLSDLGLLREMAVSWRV